MWDQIGQAAAFIRQQAALSESTAPRVGVVLGSGLGAFGASLHAAKKIPYATIPGFSKGSVEGHASELVVGTCAGTPVWVMCGRVHYYEGYSMAQVTFPMRVLQALGVQVVLLTNAAGGINASYAPGDVMLITDHLNLTGDNPLRGPNDNRLGTRFPDLTDLYDPKAREALKAAVLAQGLTAHEGVYAGLSGPCYETPAEVRMLRTLGADAVGMSTVSEAIVARHGGMRVVGMSVISNLAAGISAHPLSHEEVTATGAKVRDALLRVLNDAVPQLSRLASHHPRTTP